MTNPALLLNEDFIAFYPSLAVLLKSSDAAIMLQKLHFLSNGAREGRNEYVFVDGHWWVYNSYDQWHEFFPWISISTIKRIWTKLEKGGYVITQQGIKDPYDRKKWYRINYEYLRACQETNNASGQIEPMASGQIEPLYISNNSSENSNKNHSASAESPPSEYFTDYDVPLPPVKAKKATPDDTRPKPAGRHQQVIRALSTALAYDKGLDYDTLDDAQQKPFWSRATKLYSTDLKSQSQRTPIQPDELLSFIDAWHKLYPDWDFPTTGKLGTWFVMWRLHGTLDKKKVNRKPRQTKRTISRQQNICED